MLAAFVACAACGVAAGAVCTALLSARHWRAHVRRLAVLADVDPLTGLANRRVIERLALVGVATVWVLYLDVDRFKCVNDHHGHVAGDLLLQVVANLLRRSVRPDDLVARVGGDEFVLVLVGCTRLDALAVVSRVQCGLTGGVHGCTLSAGLCEVPSGGDGPVGTIAAAMGAADAALGAAKRLGRGNVVVAASAQWPALGQFVPTAGEERLGPGAGSQHEVRPRLADAGR
jgi:diguanylate cyclase (GGDEF)-like protein